MYGHDDKEYSEPEEDNNEVVELIALETGQNLLSFNILLCLVYSSTNSKI